MHHILTPASPSSTSSYFNCGLSETATVFLSLILSTSKKDIINFLEANLEIEGHENFTNFLMQFFKVAISILNYEAFPESWLNINILAHKVLIKMMDPIAILLERDFIPEQQNSHLFNSNMWSQALFMLLKLLSSPQLVLEELSPQVLFDF